MPSQLLHSIFKENPGQQKLCCRTEKHLGVRLNHRTAGTIDIRIPDHTYWNWPCTLPLAIFFYTLHIDMIHFNYPYTIILLWGNSIASGTSWVKVSSIWASSSVLTKPTSYCITTKSRIITSYHLHYPSVQCTHAWTGDAATNPALEFCLGK